MKKLYFLDPEWDENYEKNYGEIEKGIKKLKCRLCDKIHLVPEEVTEVTCAECLLEEDDETLYLKEEKKKKDIWIGAQKMRDEGKSLREIAKSLGVSKDTVSRHTTVSSNV